MLFGHITVKISRTNGANNRVSSRLSLLENVLAVARLEEVIAKSVTMSSTPVCQPLASLAFQATPIVRAAVELVLPLQLDFWSRG